MKRIVVASIALALLLAGCGSSVANSTDEDGWTNIGNGVQRHCDGTNLIYTMYDDSVTAVPNSPECGWTE
jgi:uncharacterized protein YceK